MPLALWQDDLIARATSVLQQDERVRAAYLIGSLARDTGDQWSDVDLLAVVADDQLAALIGDAEKIANAIAETVSVKIIFGRVVNSITPDWRRFDLSFVTEKELAARPAEGIRALFSRTDAQPAGAQRPEPSKLAENIHEFIRVLGLSPVAVGRGEYSLMLDGAMILRRILIDTMLEENGVTQADRGGALKLYPFLTEEQKRVIEALPPVAASKESALALSLALARDFMPRAKRLAAARNMPWPDAFEESVRRRLASELGATF